MNKLAQTPRVAPPSREAAMVDKSTQVYMDDLIEDDDDDDASSITAADMISFSGEEERERVECDVHHFIADFVEANAIRFSKPDFHLEIIEACIDAFAIAFQSHEQAAVYDWLDDLVQDFFSFGVCPRARARLLCNNNRRIWTAYLISLTNCDRFLSLNSDPVHGISFVTM